MKPDQLTPQDLHDLAVQKLQLENTQLKYHNFTLELFMKYGLTKDDQVAPDGKIVRASINTLPNVVEENPSN